MDMIKLKIVSNDGKIIETTLDKYLEKR